jgi:hypothetical protein
MLLHGERARAVEGADVGAAADGCGGGDVGKEADIHPHGGGDVAWRGEVGGTPVVASMKGPWQLCRRGPGMGVAVETMMGSRRRQRRRGLGSRTMRSSRFLGGPMVTTCEGGEILPSHFRPKAGPKFIGSCISSGSTWNHC